MVKTYTLFMWFSFKFFGLKDTVLIFTFFEPDYSIFPQEFLHMSIKPGNESEVCPSYRVQTFIANPFYL